MAGIRVDKKETGGPKVRRFIVGKKMSRPDFLGVAQSPKSSMSGTVGVYTRQLCYQADSGIFFETWCLEIIRTQAPKT
jgi:hypothetical protein